MKKILSIILSVVVLICAFAVPSFASEEKLTFKEAMYNAIFNMESELDLSEMEVSFDEVVEYYYFLEAQHPELYYLASVSTQSQGGVLKKLLFTYDISKEEMLSDRAFIETETNNVINAIEDDWSQTEKALYVHDWLALNYMYDYRLFENEDKENHDIVGFLKEKIGVCQSYAYTYMYILRRLGIQSYYVISLEDNHGWNVVEIDGKWYHVDTTNDDPILGYTHRYDFVGEVSHNEFLLSDTEILFDELHDNFFIPIAYTQDGYKKLEGIVCESYTGNSSWRTASTAVYKIGEYWYYIDNSANAGGLVRTKDFKNIEKIKEIGFYSDKYNIYCWQRADGDYYNRYFAGLFEYNGHLYFNDENKIYVYDSHHNVVKEIPIDVPVGKTYYGLNMDGKTITYLASDNSLWEGVIRGSYTLGVEILHFNTGWEIVKQPTQTEDGEKVKYCYFCAEIVESQTIPSLSSVILGDANGDRVVNATDLAILKLYLAAINDDISSGADFNQDGEINATDLAILKLKLAGLV